jgi:hypothetical protein
MEYTSAGCIFTNGTHILAGYQPNKPNPCISGLGGKKEEGETMLQTAVRETIEELFGFYDFPEIVSKVCLLEPMQVFHNGKYGMVVYSFCDLEKILCLVKESGKPSPLYANMPVTLSDLVFLRLAGKAEISHLCVLPLVKHDKKLAFIEPYFLKDLQMLVGLLENFAQEGCWKGIPEEEAHPQ